MSRLMDPKIYNKLGVEFHDKQRKQIAAFVEGDVKTKNTLALQIAAVSDAFKAIRSNIAANLHDREGNSYDRFNPVSPDNNSIENLLWKASKDHYKHTYYGKGATGIRIDTLSVAEQKFLKGTGTNLVPERDLDILPAIIAQLATDEVALEENQRSNLQEFTNRIMTVRAFLHNAIELHKEEKWSVYMDHATAAAAQKAILVIENDLLPKLEKLQPFMEQFDNDHYKRHGNEAYGKHLAELKNQKASKAPKTYGTGTVVAAALGSAIAGTVVGGAAVEGYHRVTDKTEPTPRVRTVDPNENKPWLDKAKDSKSGPKTNEPAP